jgi:hypothetical protein
MTVSRNGETRPTLEEFVAVHRETVAPGGETALQPYQLEILEQMRVAEGVRLLPVGAGKTALARPPVLILESTPHGMVDGMIEQLRRLSGREPSALEVGVAVHEAFERGEITLPDFPPITVRDEELESSNRKARRAARAQARRRR